MWIPFTIALNMSAIILIKRNGTEFIYAPLPTFKVSTGGARTTFEELTTGQPRHYMIGATAWDTQKKLNKILAQMAELTGDKYETDRRITQDGLTATSGAASWLGGKVYPKNVLGG